MFVFNFFAGSVGIGYECSFRGGISCLVFLFVKGLGRFINEEKGVVGVGKGLFGY